MLRKRIAHRLETPYCANVLLLFGVGGSVPRTMPGPCRVRKIDIIARRRVKKRMKVAGKFAVPSSYEYFVGMCTTQLHRRAVALCCTCPTAGVQQHALSIGW